MNRFRLLILGLLAAYMTINTGVQAQSSSLQWGYQVNTDWINDELVSNSNTHNSSRSVSKNYLPKNEDGWIEVEMTDAPSYSVIGFIASPVPGGYTSANLEYGVYRATNSIDYYKKGIRTLKASGEVLAQGDILRIERVGTTVTFKVNGVEKHVQSNVDRSRNWYVFVNLYLSGNKSGKITTSFDSDLQLYPTIDIGAVDDVMDISVEALNATGTVSYSWNTGATTNAISGFGNGTYSVTVTDDNGSHTQSYDMRKASQLQWKHQINTDWADEELVSNSNTHFSSKSVSKNFLPKNEDGWMEVEMTDLPNYTIIGFTANPNSLARSAAEIEFGVYRTTNSIDYYKKGLRTLKDNQDVLELRDVLRIERVGTTVTFKVNGEEKHVQSNVDRSRDWYVFANLYLSGNKSGKIRTDFDRDLQLYPTIDNGASDGIPKISVEALNTVGTVSYLWSTGATTSEISGLDNGTYTVTVTDDNGSFTRTYEMHKASQLQWASQVNTDWVDDELVSNSNSHFSSKSVSKNYLPKNEDGWMEIEITDAPNNTVIGFTTTHTPDAHTVENLEFGIYRTVSSIDYYEKGLRTLRDANDILELGDILRIERVGTTVTFKVNGEEKHVQSDIDRSRDWYVFAQLYQSGLKSGKIRTSFDRELQLYPTIDNGAVSGTTKISVEALNTTGTVSYLWNTGATTSEITGINNGIYTVTVSDDNGSHTQSYEMNKASQLQWGYQVNTDWVDDELVSNSNVHFSSKSVSKNYLPKNEDGWIEMEMTDLPNNTVIGFSTTQTPVAYTTGNLEFGVYRTVSSIDYYEKGLRTLRDANDILELGDVLRIERVGTTVTFSVNGEEKHVQSDVDRSRNWYLFANLYQDGLKSGKIRTSFDCDLQLYPTIDNGANDGVPKISVEALNTVGTVSYLWNTGATTSEISGLDNGTYTVTVTDDNGSHTQSYEMHKASQLQWSLQTNADWVDGELVSNSNVHFSSKSVSKNYLPKNEDGWLEIEITDVPNNTVIGFTATRNPVAYTVENLEFGIYRAVSSIDYYKKGLRTLRDSDDVLELGDVLRIERVGTTVTFKVNGEEKHVQSDVNRSRDWFVFVNLYQDGLKSGKIRTSFDRELQLYPTIDNGAVDGTMDISLEAINAEGTVSYLWDTGETTNSLSDVENGTYTVTVTDDNGSHTRAYVLRKPSKLQWSSQVGADWINDELVCTSNVHYSSKSVTKNFLPKHEDGWIEIEMTDIPNSTVIGFTTTRDPIGYTVDNLEFGVYRTASSIDYYKQGTLSLRDANDVLELGDVLRIERVGTTVTFSVNGVVTHTQTEVNRNNDWYLFVNLYLEGYKSGVISTSFDSEAQFYSTVTNNDAHDGTSVEGSVTVEVLNHVPANYSWKKNGVEIATTRDITGIESGDYELTATDANSVSISKVHTIWDNTKWLSWEGYSNVGEVLTKTTTESANNCKAISYAYLEPMQNGRVSYELKQDAGTTYIGLSERYTGLDLNSLNYAIVIYKNNGRISAYNGGYEVVRKDDKNYWDVVSQISVVVNHTEDAVSYMMDDEVIATIPIGHVGRLHTTVSTSEYNTELGALNTNFDDGIRAIPDVEHYQNAGNKGSVSLTPSGGSGSYDYSWVLDQNEVATTKDVSDLETGIYQLTVTDQADASKKLETSIAIYYRPIWQPQTDVTVNSDGTLTKTEANGNDNGHTTSFNSIARNEEGKIIYKKYNTQSGYVGLSKTQNSTDLASYSYAIWIHPHGYTHFYSYGLKIKSIENYRNRNVYEVRRTQRETGEWDIHFVANGKIEHSIEDVDGNEQLYLVSHSYYQGKTTGELYTDFGHAISIETKSLVHNEVREAVKGEIEIEVTGGAGGYSYDWYSVVKNELGEDVESPISPTDPLHMINVENGMYKLVVTDLDNKSTFQYFEVMNNLKWLVLEGLEEQADGTLKKSADLPQSWTNTKAVSSYYLKANEDGFVEWHNINPNKWVGFGLCYEDLDDYASMNYWFRIPTSNYPVNVYRARYKFTNTSTYPKYGDRYRLERKGSEVIAYINGEEIGRIPTDATRRMYVKAIVVDANASTGQVHTSFGHQQDMMVHADVTHLNAGNKGQIDLNIMGGTGTKTATWTLPDGSTLIEEDLTDLNVGIYSVVVSDEAGQSETLEFEVLNDGEWDHLVNMAYAEDGRLYKTDAVGYGTAWAKSKNYLPAGEDGFVDIRLRNNYERYMVALTDDPEIVYQQSRQSDGFYMYSSEKSFRLTDGVLVSNDEMNLMVPSDRLRVARVGNEIQYSKNGGAPFFTRPADPNQDLYVVVEVYTPDLSIDDVYTSFGEPPLAISLEEIIHNEVWSSGNGSIKVSGKGGVAPYQYYWGHGPSGDEATNLKANTYQILVRDAVGAEATKDFEVLNKVKWKSLVGLQENLDGTLTKTDANTTYNSGVGVSESCLNPDMDGHLQYVYTGEESDLYFGLSYQQWSPEPEAINYAIHIKNDGTFNAYVSGTSVLAGGYTALSNKDVFKISRENDQVKFYRNDVELHAVSTVKSRQLFTEVNLLEQNKPSGILATSYGDYLTVFSELTHFDQEQCLRGSVVTTVKGNTGEVQYFWTDGSESGSVQDADVGEYGVTVTDQEGVSVSSTMEINQVPNWNGLVNLEELPLNGALKKSNGATQGWENSSALGDYSIKEEVDGYFELVVTSLATDFRIALCESNTDMYTSSSYGLSVTSQREIERWVDGQEVDAGADLEGIQLGDVIRVARQHSDIIYTKNGVEIFRIQNVDHQKELFLLADVYQSAGETGSILFNNGRSYYVNCESVQPPLPPTESAMLFNYYEPKRKINARPYYVKNTLPFKFEARYNTYNLKYTIYDNNRNVVITESNQPLTAQLGMNRFALDISSLVSGKIYVLEIKGEKNRSFQLKFKR